MTLTYSKDLGEFLICLKEKQPQMLVVTGPQGSGKTTLTNTLASAAENPVKIHRLGSFNTAWAESDLVIVQDAADPDAAIAKIKKIIEQEEVTVERKGFGNTIIPNVISWIVEVTQ